MEGGGRGCRAGWPTVSHPTYRFFRNKGHNLRLGPSLDECDYRVANFHLAFPLVLRPLRHAGGEDEDVQV